jgi:tellurite resistance protein TerC
VSPWWWAVTAVLVVGLLLLDLLVFHRHARSDTTRQAIVWSVLWVGVGLLFALLVRAVRGPDAMLEYLTAFLIEKSLSVDNLFVFIALFAYFGVAPAHHHRILFWGILGAIITRGLFIFGGVALIQTFHWLIYVLGVVLLATAARLLFGEGEVHPERNFVVRWASRFLPVERSYHGEHFTVMTDRGRRLTPLILVLLAIETTDVMFAVDSVPAVLAVSRDVFVVYTSNIFAILGLRALYFVLAGALQALRFLRPALSLILALVGVKMLLTDIVDLPTVVSLGAVAAILVVATVLSLLWPRRPAAKTSASEHPFEG